MRRLKVIPVFLLIGLAAACSTRAPAADPPPERQPADLEPPDPTPTGSPAGGPAQAGQGNEPNSSDPDQDDASAADRDHSGNADVTFVRAVENADGSWTFHVSVAHPDIGWEDYADGWDVVLPDGTVLKPDPGSPFTRLLLHPHVDEQPFTRSQSGLVIPADVQTVTVRAHDSVDGFGGQEITLDLTQSSGEGFTVDRP